ncbi:DUF1127 domain-containing protein [Dongia soli]|uniref:DUF1127 domain-containing protein n=1 Tax=Dongia soli TaxID=600628 RepID=A0ABU5EAR3_9PROT|nr:DUF1127 domain-containing protein [Dongia soli]MDY0883367.1 DUF1127 domain-containing protein [Dongia soli]
MKNTHDIGPGSLNTFGLSRSRLTARFSLIRLLDVMSAWQARARQRRHLASLDNRLLQDIGLSRVDVEQEATKPFWRI